MSTWRPTLQKYEQSYQHHDIRTCKPNTTLKQVWKMSFLAGFFHFKSVLTDSFPQTDEPTYGRYWPSFHSRQGSVSKAVISVPSRVYLRYCTDKPHLKSYTKLNERVQYKQIHSRANFPFNSYHAGKKHTSLKKPCLIASRGEFQKPLLLRALYHF